MPIFSASSEVAEQLKLLQDRDGRLTRDAVVNEARHPESPLHSHFEWDDSIAGEKHRRYQAGVLIASVRMVVNLTHHQMVVPSYVRDPRETGMVRDITRVRKEEIQKKAVMHDYLGRLMRTTKQAKIIAQYFDLEESLDAIIAILTDATLHIDDEDDE